MQGYENSRKEQLMLFLQGQGETIDDWSKNLEKLCNSVEPLRFVDKLKEDVVYGASNIGTEIQEFTIDPVKCGLEEISFTGIFRVEKFKKLFHQPSPLRDGDLTYLKNKLMVYMCFGGICVEILAFYESQEKFIDHLYVRPSNFQNGLVLFWVKCLALRIDRWWNWSKQIFAEHVYDAGIHGLGDNRSVISDVVQ